MALLGGCGYSLEMSSVEETPEAPDPITLLKRDLRQIKADHRVSIFDLKNEQKLLGEKTKSDIDKILAKLHAQIQRDLRALEEKREASLLSLRRRDADFGEQIADMEIQLRLMGGSIEEEINRYKDSSEQTNSNALRELGNVKRLLADEGKKKKASLKMLQGQIDGEKEGRLKLETRLETQLVSQVAQLKAQIAEEKHQRETLKKTFDEVVLAQAKAEKQARKLLQGQIKQIESSSVATNASSDDQIKALNEVSAQVDQLIEKLLPAVNRLAERLDKQEEEFDSLDRKIDVDALNRQLTALTDALDVQRQSLEMLGNTLTSELGKQKRLLQKTIERLQALEPN